MAKQVILAVAGAGKTYTICNSINPNKKNLILAFTHENIHNINGELISRFGKIPELTNVMTYDAFLYRYIVCPFEPTILRSFGRDDFRRKGITTKKPPDKTLKYNGKSVPNKKYKKKETLEHYEIEGKYYCNTLAELIMYVKDDKKKLVAKVARCLNMFYDKICIDEFQDYRSYDFDFIISLAKQLTDVLLVGDYFQHSVSGDNNSGKPFDKMSMDDFVVYLEKNKLSVDLETLSKTRRCPQVVCDFVESKVGITYGCDNSNHGEIIILDNNNVSDIIRDDSIVKLVWNNSQKYTFNAVNWSYSKGDTFDSVCVVLTDIVSDITDDDFNIEKLTSITRNKLYVALTRTRGNLYLLSKNLFDEVKENYFKME